MNKCFYGTGRYKVCIYISFNGKGLPTSMDTGNSKSTHTQVYSVLMVREFESGGTRIWAPGTIPNLVKLVVPIYPFAWLFHGEKIPWKLNHLKFAIGYLHAAAAGDLVTPCSTYHIGTWRFHKRPWQRPPHHTPGQWSRYAFHHSQYHWRRPSLHRSVHRREELQKTIYLKNTKPC